MKWLLTIAVLAVVAYLGSKAYLHHEVGESVDNAVVMASPWVDIEYKGISSASPVRRSSPKRWDS